jgi:CPA2 family monovalent cation:H+ antiporter-2
MAAIADLVPYKNALVLLGTAGLVVPLMQRLRISPILGFLATGVLLGPSGLGAIAENWPVLDAITISHEREIAWLAELGVVFLLFLIGLEMSLPRFLTMRRLVFGLGTAQVVLSAAIISVIVATLLNVSAAAAVLLGASLSLSSTAMGVEILSEQNRLTSTVGRACFSILLLQDLAVVPLLFLAGILGAKFEGPIAVGLMQALGQAAAAIGVIVAIGWLLLRPLFRIVAQGGNNELFVALTLFVAVGTGVITGAAGLSMALGGFVAGLLLAETEYRKAIEATIEPFKGILLGVFFFSVGMLIDLKALASQPLYIFILAMGLVVVKASILMPLARVFGLSWPASVETGLLLSGGGEFAFIIVGIAMASGTIERGTGGALLLVVALTMAATPLLAQAGRAAARRLLPSVPSQELALQPPKDVGARVLVIGHGRVGELICSMLEEHKVSYLAIDRDPAGVSQWRSRGRPIYFGDAKQIAFLKSCGIDRADAVVVTIHGSAQIDELVRVVRSLRPDITVIVRARDAGHARHLYSIGATDAVPETIEASLQLSEAILVELGVPTGLVIASIHEKRDEFREDLQKAAGTFGLVTRAVRQKTLRKL